MNRSDKFIDIVFKAEGADLSRGFNLPSEIDTRDKFIMVAGVNNVDANTTWVDGLSIIVDSLSGLVDANY